jgi:hypothetical protein
MKKILFALSLAGLLGGGVAAQAATVEFSASKALSTTNWSDTLSFGKFDTHLGTLTGITFDLSGLVSGVGRAESMDGAATTVNLSLSSVLTLYRPDNSTLVVANPVFSTQYNFGAFDGQIDFGGSSGATTGTVSNTGSNTFVSHNASDFALFSSNGAGAISLNLNALGQSTASGAGNLLSAFQTQAAGNVKVTYEYTLAPVPEPETYAMLGAGLALLGLVRRRAAKPA